LQTANGSRANALSGRAAIDDPAAQEDQGEVMDKVNLFMGVVGGLLAMIAYCAYLAATTLEKALKELEAIRHFTQQSARNTDRQGS